jgi:hypothetical protein
MSDVKLFLDTAGVVKNDESRRLYHKLLAEESIEFWDGFNLLPTNEFKAKVLMLDGLADKLFINECLYLLDNHLQGYNTISVVNECRTLSTPWFKWLQVERAFEEVCRSNLTKFDRSIDEVEKTRKSYEKLGIEVSVTKVGELYAVKSATESELFPVGKLLKSVTNYEKPNLEDILLN